MLATNFCTGLHRSGLPPCDVEFLSRVTALSGLKPEIAERVIASGSVVTLTRGETLFRQGDRATAFFIVVDGWVKLYRTTFSGEEVVLDVLTKAESVAVAAALSGDCYAATAEVVSDACVIRIPADRVVPCIRKMPEIAVSMCASTLQHIDRLTQQIEQLKSQSIVQRVAAFLASLCPVDDGPCRAALPYAKILIAARLGMKSESLSRVFFKLRLIGVEMHGSQLVVRDVGKLRQLAADGHIRSYSALSYGRASSPHAPSDAPTRTHRVERGLAAVADDLQSLGQRLEHVVGRLDDLEAQLTDLNRRLDALEESAAGMNGFTQEIGELRHGVRDIERRHLGIAASRVAPDFAISTAERQGVLGFGGGGFDPLLIRMKTLHLESDEVKRIESTVFCDLANACANCECMERCERDLAQEAAGAVTQDWESYCPNAAILNAMKASPWFGKRK